MLHVQVHTEGWPEIVFRVAALERALINSGRSSQDGLALTKRSSYSLIITLHYITAMHICTANDSQSSFFRSFFSRILSDCFVALIKGPRYICIRYYQSPLYIETRIWRARIWMIQNFFIWHCTVVTWSPKRKERKEKILWNPYIVLRAMLLEVWFVFTWCMPSGWLAVVRYDRVRWRRSALF